MQHLNLCRVEGLEEEEEEEVLWSMEEAGARKSALSFVLEWEQLGGWVGGEREEGNVVDR